MVVACGVGAECDQMVLSDGESSGVVTSPNYPRHYPINVTCHYYIDGLVDRQNLEKVKLLFDDFHLPTVPAGSVLTPSSLPTDRAGRKVQWRNYNF